MSRLLIDLNRSLHHPALFSEFCDPLGDEQRRALVTRYHEPFRQRVRRQIEVQLSRGHAVLHLSVHSFTPVLNGQVRSTDLGLLYDPGRDQEATRCARWCRRLSSTVRGLRVRRNYPYRGTADGHTTALRRLFRSELYAGIELELNQSLSPAQRHKLLYALIDELRREGLAAPRPAAQP